MRARDLAPALALAIVVQCVCAWLLGGRLHPDETHQYLDVAHRLVWSYGTRPHEWYSGMRNLVAPGALAGVLALARIAGLDDPRAYLLVVHGLVGALSLTTLPAVYELVLVRTGERALSRATVGCLALWVPWQAIAYRTLGETLSTVAVLHALARWSRTPRPDAVVGVLVAAAFVLRYPAGVYLLPFASAYLWRRDFRGLARWSSGVAAVLLALGALDLLTWGSPWHSVRAYLDYNLLRDRARIDYGARPWWTYLAWLPAFAPAPWIIAAARGARWRRGGMTLAVLVVYLGAMSAIAHKELRFVLPAVPLVVVASALAAGVMTRRRLAVALGLSALQSVVVLVALARSAVFEGDAVRAAEWVGRQPDAGALALVGVSHPGYAHLHRNIPVYGDARNDVARALASLEGRWPAPTRGRFYALCLRATGCEQVLRARAWRPVQTFQRVMVLVSGR